MLVDVLRRVIIAGELGPAKCFVGEIWGELDVFGSGYSLVHLASARFAGTRDVS